MPDWATISALATASGTLVLAGGFWQGAFRDASEPLFGSARDAINARQRIAIDGLYGDHEGGQRTISRFALMPREDGRLLTSIVRHWNLDRAAPRDEQ